VTFADARGTSAVLQVTTSEFRSQLRASTHRDELICAAKELSEFLRAIPALWNARNKEKVRESVDLSHWNCTLDGANLSVTYKKPFRFFAEGTKTQIWRPSRDEFLKSLWSGKIVVTEDIAAQGGC
jgi:hypothetical protein